ncbi:methyltransferase domain-containing protein [Synechococcus sp. FGCU-3]|jgi:malonyl-CoA O-methyltransferase|nr:methyltransferase domain-containing protein [Synechococcus sp. FGCU3]
MSDGFSRQVEARFGRGAARYAEAAVLQRAVAWRLVRQLQHLPLPAGPCADLGAGSGTVAQAMAALTPELHAREPLQLDLTPALLARNPLVHRQLAWDLNGGLPAQLQGTALLTSNFALQWLTDPASQLKQWCRALTSGGVLALAVPVAGSFRQWQRAAETSGVPCTALPLPPVEALIAAASNELDLLRCQQLKFSRQARGLELLRQMRTIGADASQAPRLSGAQLRRLLRHWPPGPTTWEVLLLLGRRP